jgi:DUF971 family protein
MPWPTDLRFKRDRKLLEIDFDDGETFALPFELLRVESPSAEVQGHGPSQKQIVPGKRHVGVSGVVPTGNYAIRIQFDDGHETGIFSWDYLHKLGSEQAEIWATYVAALADRALSRDA